MECYSESLISYCMGGGKITAVNKISAPSTFCTPNLGRYLGTNLEDFGFWGISIDLGVLFCIMQGRIEKMSQEKNGEYTDLKCDLVLCRNMDSEKGGHHKIGSL